MWAAGCIFAELLFRKPLFPGRNYMHQIETIVSVIGTPSEDLLAEVGNAQAREYVRGLGYKPPVKLQSLYPNANPLALDLLGRMVHFSPTRRITVQQALQHPYFTQPIAPGEQPMYNAEDVVSSSTKFNFDFEKHAALSADVYKGEREHCGV